MSGIVFFFTRDLEGIVAFYTGKLGAIIWLQQDGCTILQHGNMLFGLCTGETAETEGNITFFYNKREEVDALHGVLAGTAIGPPKENPLYRIYNFFARDPEGRRIEVQTFLHTLPPHTMGADLLASRRSIRHYTGDNVDEALVQRVLEDCSLAPSSRNRQPCRFVVVRDRKKLELLASLRGESSAPLARSPMAVAVVVDTTVSSRPVEDGSIMTYHLLLAAHMHGLGTCWIAAMDREDVKEALGIPPEHYVAAMTPLGWPESVPRMPPRSSTRVEYI